MIRLVNTKKFHFGGEQNVIDLGLSNNLITQAIFQVKFRTGSGNSTLISISCRRWWWRKFCSDEIVKAGYSCLPARSQPARKVEKQSLSFRPSSGQSPILIFQWYKKKPWYYSHHRERGLLKMLFIRNNYKHSKLYIYIYIIWV